MSTDTQQVIQDILGDFSTKLKSSSIIKKASVYYRNGGELVEIVTIVPNEDSRVEGAVYGAEAKVLKKWSDQEMGIDFRLTPAYGVPHKRLIPESFHLWRART